MKTLIDQSGAMAAIGIGALLLWNFVGHIARCLYCGSIGGHKQNCPFDLNREER